MSALVRVSKHKAASGWAVHLDGKATGLFIVKGEAPRWGAGQDWEVMRGEGLDAEWMFQARSCDAALNLLAELFQIGRGQP